MVCPLCKPMKVWFITKPLAEFTNRWAEPGIAGMSLMDLITSQKAPIS